MLRLRVAAARAARDPEAAHEVALCGATSLGRVVGLGVAYVAAGVSLPLAAE